jgi:hypothetical protein
MNVEVLRPGLPQLLWIGALLRFRTSVAGPSLVSWAIAFADTHRRQSGWFWQRYRLEQTEQGFRLFSVQRGMRGGPVVGAVFDASYQPQASGALTTGPVRLSYALVIGWPVAFAVAVGIALFTPAGPFLPIVVGVVATATYLLNRLLYLPSEIRSIVNAFEAVAIPPTVDST